MGPSFGDLWDNLSSWPELYIFWTAGSVVTAVSLGAYVYMMLTHRFAGESVHFPRLTLGILSLIPVPQCLTEKFAYKCF